MYAGTDRDAVYQAAIAQKQRDSRSALTTVFNSLTNSTNRANTTQRQTTGRTTAGNAAQTNRATNQNRR